MAIYRILLLILSQCLLVSAWKIATGYKDWRVTNFQAVSIGSSVIGKT